MNPATQHQAAAQAMALLAYSQPGAAATVKAHLKRAATIGAVIWRRFNTGPYRWRAKHLRWYLDRHCHDLSPSTRYDQWRTIRSLVTALNRGADWLPLLRGPWVRPTGDYTTPLGGGRPARLPGKAKYRNQFKSTKKKDS